MEVRMFVTSLATATRAWRERTIAELQDLGCTDLSYRPCTGMSAYGWLLAHQGAAYDYTVNMLIKQQPPKNPGMFYLYRGDSTDTGDWKGTPLDEIYSYFDSVEKDFIEWFESAADEELNRILEGPSTPEYFKGKRVMDAITDMFAHLNHHNGHLSALKVDWYRKKYGK